MPIEPQTPEVVAWERALTLLKGAIATLKLYPKESPICQETMKSALTPIQACLQNVAEVLISDTDRTLMLNGTQPISVKGVREIFGIHRVRNLTFVKGVTAAEIGVLCEGLSKKKEDLADFPNFGAWLTAKGVKNIKADEIRYIDVKEDERIIIRGKGEYSADGATATGIIQTMKDKMQQISQLPDATIQTALRESLVKDAAQLTPEELQELFTSKESQTGPLADVVENLAQSLPLNKIEEILRFVAERSHQIKVQVQSQSDRTQRLGLLKSFMRQVLNAPASREISPQLYSYLSSLGLLENATGESLKGGDYFSFTAVAKNLMELPSSFLITEPLCDHMLELVKNLCAKDSAEALQELLDKILENLENFDDAIRGKTVLILAKIHSILMAHIKADAADTIMQILLKLHDSERSLEAYKSITSALLSVAMDQLVNWRYEQTTTVLSQLRRHSQEDFAFPQGRFEQARQGLRQFGQRAIEALCSDLAANQPQHQRGVMSVMVQLGAEAVDPLLEVLRRAPSPRAQQTVFQAMESLGLPAHKLLVERLDTGSAAKNLVQILPLLIPYASAAMLPKILPLLQHPSGSVRKEAVQLLYRIKDKSLSGLLIQLLRDPDPHVQETVVRCLTELRPQEAAEKLAKLLPTVPPALQEEICICLGALRNPLAIPALIECLTASTGFMSKKTIYEEAVRVRAASALGFFRTDSKVRRALESAMKDSNPLVQQTAEQVLRSNL